MGMIPARMADRPGGTLTPPRDVPPGSQEDEHFAPVVPLRRRDAPTPSDTSPWEQPAEQLRMPELTERSVWDRPITELRPRRPSPDRRPATSPTATARQRVALTPRGTTSRRTVAAAGAAIIAALLIATSVVLAPGYQSHPSARTSPRAPVTVAPEVHRTRPAPSPRPTTSHTRRASKSRRRFLAARASHRVTRASSAHAATATTPIPAPASAVTAPPPSVSTQPASTAPVAGTPTAQPTQPSAPAGHSNARATREFGFEG